jgi:MFS family permease
MSQDGHTPGLLPQISILIITAFIDMMGLMMILPILPFRAVALHATPFMTGFIIAGFSVAQLLASPMWGRISDRYGRRPALLAGLFASGIAYLVFGYATSVAVLFLSRIIQGAGGGTTGVIHAYVADRVAPGDRARALGWISSASLAGVTLGPQLGSFGAYLGPRAAPLIAAGLCFLNVIFAWRWLPESKPSVVSEAAPPRRGPMWALALRVIGDPWALVPRFVWIYGAGMLGFTVMTSVLQFYLAKEFGITEKTIGYFFSYVGVLSVIMRSLLLGPIVKRFGEITTVRAGTVVLTLGLVLYPTMHSLWVLAIAVIPLVPIGTALLFPSTTSLMSRHALPTELGETMGVAQTFAGMARVIAPLIGTAAFQYIGAGAPFVVGGMIVALVGVLAFRLPPTVMTVRPEAS